MRSVRRYNDHVCHSSLQIAAYAGANAPQQARDVGVTACTIHGAARELMTLVVAAEEDAKRRRPESG